MSRNFEIENADLHREIDLLSRKNKEIQAAALKRDAEIERLNKRREENEDQLCRIANYIGKDARDATDDDLTIAGVTIAEIAALRKAHANLFATSQEMNADLVALRAEIAAAKAQPKSPLQGMEDMVKVWYSRYYAHMRKHMPEYSEIELEAYMGSARMHYIEGFSDARLAHLMDEQNGTTESTQSEA